jgi:hypothetical protein
MLNMVGLLSLRGLDTNSKMKLVRHQDKRYDIQELRRQGLLELYQSYQSKPVLECDYVVSFIGLEGSKACLFGVYRVKGRKSASEVPLPDDFVYLVCDSNQESHSPEQQIAATSTIRI